MTAVNLTLRTVALVFGAYISRTVGAEGIGLNTLITTVYSFALTFATSGVSLTVTRLVASLIGEGREKGIGRTLRGAIIYSLAFSGAATAALAGLSGFFVKVAIGDTRALLPLQILSLSLIPAALTGVFSGYFIGVRHVSRNAAIQVLGQFLRVGLTVYLLTSMASGGVESAVAALCIGSTAAEFLTFIAALITYFLDRAATARRWGDERGSDVRSVGAMALPLAISAYIRSALLALEHSIIPKRLEKRGESLSEALSSFGIMHGMALPVILYPMSPLSSFSGLLVPEFAETDAAGEAERASRMASEALTATLGYSIAVSVMLYVFSEELGYSVYGSYGAGYFIAMLSPVVPIMYLDHVVDSILKGIGEHVYSMWVNIIDSALSVILVWLLLPIFGISGYAFVIVGMEGFNFILSLTRLRRRMRLKIDLYRAIAIPAVSALSSAVLVRTLFLVGGSTTGGAMLALKIIFSVAAYIAVKISLTALYERRPGRRA